PVWVEGDAAFGKGGEQSRRGVGRRRDRRRLGRHQRDLRAVSSASLGEEVVEEQRGLAGRRWALEGQRRHPDDDSAALEVLEDLEQPEGRTRRVELMTAVEQTRRRLGV